MLAQQSSVVGYTTTLSALFADAASKTPDKNKWDFEPDSLSVKEGTVLSVVDQGGEPHTFTESKTIWRRLHPGLKRRPSAGSRMRRWV